MSKIIITIKRIYRLTLAVLAVLGTVAIMGFVSPRVEYLEKPVHIPVEKPQPTLKELVNTVPDKYGISPLIVGAMLERESGARMDAIRFEPHHLNRVQSLCKGRGSDYCRQLASSRCASNHGLVGAHARYNLGRALRPGNQHRGRLHHT